MVYTTAQYNAVQFNAACNLAFSCLAVVGGHCPTTGKQRATSAFDSKGRHDFYLFLNIVQKGGGNKPEFKSFEVVMFSTILKKFWT